MSNKILNTRVVNKHGTESNWILASDFTPLNGEIIVYDKDENYNYKRVKIGDGVNNINNLDFLSNEKANKSDLSNYLTKEEYIAGELGGDVVLSNILQLVYPIGAIYISTTEVNPATLFGFGTWEQIKDRFLLAAGDTYAAGALGGEAQHTLTEAEMPAHAHSFERHQLWRNEQDPPSDTEEGYGASNKSLPVYTDTTATVGGSQAHNNMPPYLTVYMWRRTF